MGINLVKEIFTDATTFGSIAVGDFHIVYGEQEYGSSVTIAVKDVFNGVEKEHVMWKCRAHLKLKNGNDISVTSASDNKPS